MLRFMCSNGGIYRAYRVFRLMYSDEGLYRAYRVLRLKFGDGGLYWACIHSVEVRMRHLGC